MASEIAASMRPKCDLNSRGPEHVTLGPCRGLSGILNAAEPLQRS